MLLSYWLAQNDVRMRNVALGVLIKRVRVRVKLWPGVTCLYWLPVWEGCIIKACAGGNGFAWESTTGIAHPFVHQSIYLANQSSLHPSIHPSFHSNICPSIYSSIYQQMYVFVNISKKMLLSFFLRRCLGQSSSMKWNGASVLHWGENVKTVLWTNFLMTPCGTSSGTWWASFGWLDIIIVCSSINFLIIYALHLSVASGTLEQAN